ncbi:dihydrodipicolinate synthase family protein [Corynebacterium yudongzhengii]|uniref:Dihydrodipicolinate synthase family protein n=1 Tax=Corynebacterium yudongzhengii TaxID=2080740 RepID=A0A2U1T9V1_9CORY|nr:dihydrodipicolinate synthase family protein [Corynebacterium yudongzhengii]AWB81230.1 dihydrodipicolinate synthase family protein [Corynebacterium yudongzhengii]PWC02769.1 dihydrodipicolinate synthase family protein [Corynebacterium yudongzhengii]
MTASFRGVIPPVVIARHEDRTLDSASYERNLSRLIDAGVDGLFILGSSGEGAFCTASERQTIIDRTLSVVDGRLPVLVGCIDTQTQRVIEHVQQAEAAGADAVVVTAPFYALGGPAQVEEHFRLIAAATTLPVFAYDIPVCVHTKLDNDMLVRLGKEGVLAGVKDSSGDDVGFRLLIQANEEAGHPLTLLTGHEVVVDGAYLAGADGCVPGLGNVDPEGYVRQWKAAETGDWQWVKKEQDRLAKLMRVAMLATSISGFGAGVGGFKAALKLLGVFDSAQMPQPVAQLRPDEVDAVKATLIDAGLL